MNPHFGYTTTKMKFGSLCLLSEFIFFSVKMTQKTHDRIFFLFSFTLRIFPQNDIRQFGDYFYFILATHQQKVSSSSHDMIGQFKWPYKQTEKKNV